MHSKISKQSNKRPPKLELQLWKAATDCSEDSVLKIARDFTRQLRAGDRVLLEGPMGAGKTTFSRALLEGLGITQPPEGSPTFAIAHQYRAPIAEVFHIDFYRIRSEAEIDEAGIPAYFWDPEAIVLAEWTSLWPVFEASVLNGAVSDSDHPVRNWRVTIDFSSDPTRRNIKVFSSRVG